MGFVLRDYQQECVEKVLAAYKKNPSGEDLIELATGGGKTVIFSTIVETLAREYGTCALIIAHRDELLEQARDKYLQVKPSAIVGKVGSGVYEYGGEVTVCSIMTISRPDRLKHLKFLYGTGKNLIIIVDEAHHCVAKSYQVVLGAFPDAFVLKVTATPNRLDGKKIINKPPIFSRSIIDLIRAKYLSNVRAIAVRTDTDLDQVASRKNKDGEIDFDEGQLDLVINTPERNNRIVEAYQEHCSGISFIVFCVSIEHAKALEYAFNDMGISTRCVIGSTDGREHIYKAVEDGSVTGITNVGVLTEGFDLPPIKCVILARPTQSESLYKQMIGRGMRIFENQDCIILDITDNTFKYRLQRQSLRKSTGIGVQDGETLLDALEREEEEKEQRAKAAAEAQIRKLKERRPKDVHIDLLTIIQWEDLPTGGWRAIVGSDKHRVAILPCEGDLDLFYVAARLYPNLNTAQRWSGDLPLEEAQQIAEKRILILCNEGTALVDRNAPWRSRPVDPDSKQAGLARKYRIEIPEGMTKGELSDLIDQHKDEIAARKKAKAAKQAEKDRKYAEELANVHGNHGFSLMKR
jgi:superfamily II DNA or RNA helicase